MKNLKFISTILIFILFSCSNDDNTPNNEIAIDIDGNTYNTVKIGSQIWMTENLKTTRLKDGTPLIHFTENTNISWSDPNSPSSFYQWARTDDPFELYDNELPINYFGAIYNHWTIKSGMLAPNGWRIPTEQDFIELENYIASQGHSGNEATVLKSKNGWIDSSGNGLDLYNFNALPNGYAALGGGLIPNGIILTWATSTINQTNQTRRTVSLFEGSTVNYNNSIFHIGAGVRCIKE